MAGRYLQNQKISQTTVAKWADSSKLPDKRPSKLHHRGVRPMLRRSTYGFMGSLKVSRKSSILLVCVLIVSRILELSVESELLGAPKLFCPPKL